MIFDGRYRPFRTGALMNYSICLLKLTVGLCLGFVSVITWAAGYNDNSSLETEVIRGETWAVATDYDDNLIKKAWSCDPRYYEEWTEHAPYYLEKIIRFDVDRKSCKDEGKLMRRALLNKYFIFRWEPEVFSKEIVAEEEKQVTFDDFVKKSSGFYRNGGIRLRGVDHSLFDEERKRRNQNYSSALKSGATPVKNFQDAVLLHAPTADLTDLMISPLLKPDRGIYRGLVRLDAQEGDDLLRAKIDSPLFNRRLGGEVYYAHLLLTGKTVNFSPRSMRIGWGVNVIGRYVQNRKYTTIAGEERTMPVFEVMYIGN